MKTNLTTCKITQLNLRINNNKFFNSQYKSSVFSAFIDPSTETGKTGNQPKDYIDEFLDCHATLIEFESHRNNILATHFNTISIGMAFNHEKVVVCDLFTTR